MGHTVYVGILAASLLNSCLKAADLKQHSQVRLLVLVKWEYSHPFGKIQPGMQNIGMSREGGIDKLNQKLCDMC